jgi:hypothetical protein
MFACKWRDAFFGTGVQAQRSLGFDDARWQSVSSEATPAPIPISISPTCEGVVFSPLSGPVVIPRRAGRNFIQIKTIQELLMRIVDATLKLAAF